MDKKDYIERGAVIDVILKQPPEPHYPEWYYSDVKNIPAADVAPVVHGEWREDFEGDCYCTACGCYPKKRCRKLLPQLRCEDGRRKKRGMNEQGLKPCPFCGKAAELKIYQHIPNGLDYTPRCSDPSCCGRLSKKYGTRELAIYMWNRRATDER